MISKTLSHFICLSLALIQIQGSYVGDRDQFSDRRQDVEPMRDYEHPHHHSHHRTDGVHHKRHSTHPSINKSKHELMVRLFNALANRTVKKAGVVDMKSGANLIADSKAQAYVISKWNTTILEQMVTNNMQNNESKVLSRTIAKNGETDAIVNFNSDLGFISGQVLEAKSAKVSKPGNQNELIKERRHHRHRRHHHHHHHHKHHDYSESGEDEGQNELRRVKRDVEVKEDNSEPHKKKNFFQSVGHFVGEASKKVDKLYKDHIKPHLDKAGNEIHNTFNKVFKKKDKAGSGQTVDVQNE